MATLLETQQERAKGWFKALRDKICDAYEAHESQAEGYNGTPACFKRKTWQRDGGGGGEMSLMRGRFFEKVGVNISTVHGEFSESFRSQIPGAEEDPRFWASGISLVAHMANPHVPAIHMNTRFIVVGDGGAASGTEQPSGRCWFGGGTDLNPIFETPEIEAYFHAQLKACCDRHNPDYYADYKAWCDRYFFIPHRNEPRGAGGIFYDYLNSGDWDADFAFTQDVGQTFLAAHQEVMARTQDLPWTQEDREHQFFKRGRYAEFNLVHDRGTKFGLMTGGNAEAILMSLPPQATW